MSGERGAHGNRDRGPRTGGPRQDRQARTSGTGARSSAAPTNHIVQPARRVAYEVIAAVREDDAYANLLLPTRIQRAALSTADAALATELTYGTLRMQGFYDRVIAEAA
ncbi:MAG: transcription antitermination factor NusB, partial [Cryobacterium sp.]